MRTKFYLQTVEVRENFEYLNVGVKIVLNSCSTNFVGEFGLD
jgi:hypothetical protein